MLFHLIYILTLHLLYKQRSEYGRCKKIAIMRPIIIYVIIAFLCESCSSSKEYVQESQYKLDVPQQPSEDGDFNNHFELVEVIPLETSEEFLVSDIKRLIRYEDKLILLSGNNNTVFVIHAKTGKIERAIVKIGAGPGEWKNILDIAFDETSQKIAIYNDYSKVVFYNLEGEFLSELNVEGLFEELSWYEGKFVFSNLLEGYSYVSRYIKVFHQKDQRWEEIGDVNNQIDFPIRSLGRSMVKSNRLWLTTPLDFNLLSYDGNRLVTVYDLMLTTPKINDDLKKLSLSNSREFLKEVAKNKLIYSMHSIRETTDYIVFKSNQEGIFVLDKKTNEVFWNKYVAEESLNMHLTQYYPHDGNDDKIMFVIPPELFTKNLQKNVDRQYKFSPPKVDDNPILLFYKQKTLKE